MRIASHSVKMKTNILKIRTPKADDSKYQVENGHLNNLINLYGNLILRIK